MEGRPEFPRRRPLIQRLAIPLRSDELASEVGNSEPLNTIQGSLVPAKGPRRHLSGKKAPGLMQRRGLRVTFANPTRKGAGRETVFCSSSVRLPHAVPLASSGAPPPNARTPDPDPDNGSATRRHYCHWPSTSGRMTSRRCFGFVAGSSSSFRCSDLGLRVKPNMGVP